MTVKLSAHRESHRMSQTALAAAIHRLGYPVQVDHSTISLWETGKVRVPNKALPLIAAALHLDFEDICLPEVVDEDEEPSLPRASGL